MIYWKSVLHAPICHQSICCTNICSATCFRWIRICVSFVRWYKEWAAELGLLMKINVQSQSSLESFIQCSCHVFTTMTCWVTTYALNSINTGIGDSCRWHHKSNELVQDSIVNPIRSTEVQRYSIWLVCA